MGDPMDGLQLELGIEVQSTDQRGDDKVCLSCEGDLRGELVWCKACERKMETLYSQLERS